MSTAVVAYESASLNDRMKYAQTLAAAGDLIPKGLWSPVQRADGSMGAPAPSPGKVLLVMETGAMLGLMPAAALQSIDVVEGRATLSARLMGALIRKAGHKLEVQKSGSIPTGDYSVTVTGTRADDGSVFTSTWDIPRAIRAQLVQSYQENAQGVWEVRARNKDGSAAKPWEAYAELMPVWRAMSEVGREGFADVLFGLYSTEEMTDGGIPIAEPDPEPTEDWLALIAAASTRGDLDAIKERIAAKGEGTDKVRAAWLARAGVLAREADTVDAEVVEDTPGEEASPEPSPASSGGTASEAPRNSPPPAWRASVASASTVAGVQALRQRALGAGWMNPDVASALDAREATLRAEDTRSEEDYEAQASAEFDAAVARGEVPGD